MTKKIMGLLLIWAALGWSGFTNAALINFKFDPVQTPNGLSGGFTFDDATNAYSNVNIEETQFFIESWTSLFGDASTALAGC